MSPAVSVSDEVNWVKSSAEYSGVKYTDSVVVATVAVEVVVVVVVVVVLSVLLLAVAGV